MSGMPASPHAAAERAHGGASRIDAVERRIGADRRRARVARAAAAPPPSRRDRDAPPAPAGAAAGARASSSSQALPSVGIAPEDAGEVRHPRLVDAGPVHRGEQRLGRGAGHPAEGYAPTKALTSMRISRWERRRGGRCRAAFRQRTSSSSAGEQQVLEVAQLGPAGLDRQVAAPEQPLDARRRRGTPRACRRPRRCRRDRPTRSGGSRRSCSECSQSPPPPMWASRKRTAGWRAASRPSSRRVRRLLPGVVPAAVLPDVVQDRDAALGRQPADRVEQRIVGATAGGQLDADHARRRGSAGSPRAPRRCSWD